MIFVCKGTMVKEPSDIKGIILAVDKKTNRVVIQKEAGGFTSCPINLIKAVSYKGAEPAGAPLESAFNYGEWCSISPFPQDLI